MANHKLYCPSCGMADQIAKVSGKYRGGRSSQSLSGPTMGVTMPIDGMGSPLLTGSYTELSGVNQSELSRMLAPPLKPVPKGRSFMATLGLLILTIPCSCCLLPYFNNTFEASPIDILRSWGWLFIALIALILGSGVVTTVRSHIRVRKAMPRWQQAMARWHRLYYCARCDGVFNPSTGTFVSPSRMNELL